MGQNANETTMVNSKPKISQKQKTKKDQSNVLKSNSIERTFWYQ